MSDGAHQGVTPERALKTILGGEPAPTPDEGNEWFVLRDKVRDAAPNPDTYDGCALRAARLILEYFDEDEEREALPTENVYAKDTDGQLVWEDEGRSLKLVQPGLYEVMKEAGITELEYLGLTGFQWGWAVNAARHIKGLPPVPNPAIITIGSDS